MSGLARQIRVKCIFFLVVFLATFLSFNVAFAGHHEQKKDIVDTAVGAGDFKTLVAAVKAAGLVDTLKGNGPFTIFAPTDEAFAKLPAGTVESLLKPENLSKLKSILTYHVVSGKVDARSVAGLDSAKTVNGQDIAVAIKEGQLTINKSKVVANDIDCSNGVIHVIDQVLIPEEPVKHSSLDSAPTGARALVELALSKGAPLYNHGQKKACADIYEVAAQGLLSGFSGELTGEVQMRLRQGLRQANRAANDHERAWTLRHTLDDVYREAGATSNRRASVH